MPPYIVLRDVFDRETVDGLLAFAKAHRYEFSPTKLGGKEVKVSVRLSEALRELGPLRHILESKILELAPALVRNLGMAPFEFTKPEIELVAHRDGALFKPHTDTLTAHYNESERVRVLSAVYYFHAEPKQFTGGTLRLYPIGAVAGGQFIDIEPVLNGLVVFPSWVRHEVLVVNCPSGDFADSRFAVNFWLSRNKPVAPA